MRAMNASCTITRPARALAAREAHTSRQRASGRIRTRGLGVPSRKFKRQRSRRWLQGCTLPKSDNGSSGGRLSRPPAIKLPNKRTCCEAIVARGHQ